MYCPRCYIPLSRQNYLQLQIWGCGQCGGRAAVPGSIKGHVAATELSNFFDMIKKKSPLGLTICPICKQDMSEGELASNISVDGCAKCRLIWFDVGELEQMVYESPADSPPQRILPSPSRHNALESQITEERQLVRVKPVQRYKQQGLKCSRCRIFLIDTRSSEGKIFICSKCNGNLLQYKPTSEPQLRDYVLKNSKTSILDCMGCAQKMKALRTDDPRKPEVDICLSCDLIWFDRGEMSKWGLASRLPWTKRLAESRLVKPDPRSTHPDVAVILEMQLKLLRQTAHERKSSHPELGLFDWKLLPAFFLFPIERDEESYHRAPYATFSLTAFLVLMFFIARENPQKFIEWLALIPNSAHFPGTSFLTYGFVHLSTLHLVSNLYFFITFGDTVELKLGPKFMMLLFGGGVLAGAFAEWLIHQNSKNPIIGASAGVSAIMAFYCIKWSAKQLSFSRLNILSAPLVVLKAASTGSFLFMDGMGGGTTPKLWWSIPAWIYLGIWGLLQVYGVEKGI